MSAHIDLEEMRKRLRNQQKVLAKRVEIERDKVEPALTTNPDRTDMAYDYDYRGRRLSVIDQLEGQLVEVEQALERIEEGTYGICINCGQSIQAERLEALPSAALCINCQRQEA